MTPRVIELVNYVEGGLALSLEDVALNCGYDLDTFTDEELDQLDDALFTCEVCGWLQPTDNRPDASEDEDVCDQCQDDH